MDNIQIDAASFRSDTTDIGALRHAAVQTMPEDQNCQDGGKISSDCQSGDVASIPALKKRGRTTSKAKADAVRIGYEGSENQASDADPQKLDHASTNAGVEARADHSMGGNQRSDVDARFTDPLVAQIVQAHRMRRRWMKARNALILQAKAFGRAIASATVSEVDDAKRLKKIREAGTLIYAEVVAGKCADPTATIALLPFIDAAARLDQDLDRVEADLVKLAKKLPIANFVAQVSGFGWGSLAAFVGECGDISEYQTVSGVWKRAGLAVINGERQRKCADAEKALLHGYSPERRSVFWVAADAMAKHQRTWSDKVTGEIKKAPGTYGAVLERAKEAAIGKGWTPARAEAHGKRLMTKALLRDLWVEWRKVKGTYSPDGIWPGSATLDA